MTLDKSAAVELGKEFPSLNSASGERPPIFSNEPGGAQLHGSVIEAMTRCLAKRSANQNAPFAQSERTSDSLWVGRGAIADLVNARGPEEIVFGFNMTSIRGYEAELCADMIQGLKANPGLHIYGITEPSRLGKRVPSVSFTMEGLATREIGE